MFKRYMIQAVIQQKCLKKSTMYSWMMSLQNYSVIAFLGLRTKCVEMLFTFSKTPYLQSSESEI